MTLMMRTKNRHWQRSCEVKPEGEDGFNTEGCDLRFCISVYSHLHTLRFFRSGMT